MSPVLEIFGKIRVTSTGAGGLTVVRFYAQKLVFPLGSRIAMHARLFFRGKNFRSARPFSGLHAYFSLRKNPVCTIIKLQKMLLKSGFGNPLSALNLDH